MRRIVSGRRAWTIAVAGLTSTLIPSAAADSHDLARVSGADPFANCTAGDVAGTGFLFPSAEEEPSLSVNPRDHSNIIGAWQQDRWSTGGARGLVAAASRDGGKHFSTVPLPFSSCAPAGLHYDRASDPWISIGPDGTAYGVSISFDAASPRSAVGAASSTDGGLTWRHTTAIIQDADPTVFNDKEAVTADPVHAGVAYAVWDRGTAVDQPAYLSRTTDGGATWSTPQRITASSASEGTIGNIIVVDPRNGTLYDVYNRFFLNANGVITSAEEAIITSTDGGATWSSPVTIGQDRDVPVMDPFTGSLLRTSGAPSIPSIAIDPRNGQLYVAWEDARFSSGPFAPFNEVVFSTSTDGGATWTAATRISTPTGTPAFTPIIAVSANGTVGVTYYDLRNLPQADPATLPTNSWLITSPPGGGSFGAEQAIVEAPFDHFAAPVSQGIGYFLGDYEGLATSGDSFLPLFIKTNGVGAAQNRTDVFLGGFQPESGERSSSAAAVPAAGLQAPASASGPARLIARHHRS